MENAKLQKIEKDHKNKYKSYHYSSICTICFTKRKGSMGTVTLLSYKVSKCFLHWLLMQSCPKVI